MAANRGQPPDDESSAPESGTVCDETSGNRPSKGAPLRPGQDVTETEQDPFRPGQPADVVSNAPESGTVR